MDEFRWLDATAQADLVRRREVEPAELIDAALARIEALNPRVNAVVTPIDPRPPHADAPFTGVPFLVKDLGIEVAGTRFTEGSRWLAGNARSCTRCAPDCTAGPDRWSTRSPAPRRRSCTATGRWATSVRTPPGAPCCSTGPIRAPGRRAGTWPGTSR
jgi:hypothetical protein